jgi:hypothetical protein
MIDLKDLERDLVASFSNNIKKQTSFEAIIDQSPALK